MRLNIIVKCVGEDGKQSTIALGTIERLAGSTTAESLDRAALPNLRIRRIQNLLPNS
jgi:hypothetical protein